MQGMTEIVAGKIPISVGVPVRTGSARKELLHGPHL